MCILCDQLAQFVCQERAHTAPFTGCDGSRLLQQAGLDGNGNIVLDRHFRARLTFT